MLYRSLKTKQKKMDKYHHKEVEAIILREYAFQHGKAIYDFMDTYDIGKSAYGQLMDQAGKGKHIMAHRLYGHNLVYDFPIDELHNANDFFEHLLSDLFTKQGIPILPGEILNDLGLIKACDKLKGSWNLVNGFDILSATIAIYKGFDKFKKAYDGVESVDDFKDLANTFGVGALEMAIALSTANPFLMIGSVLHLTAGLQGLFNDGTVIYFTKLHNKLTVSISVDAMSINTYLDSISLQASLDGLSVEDEIESMLPRF